jgi:hypothetical protein
MVVASLQTFRASIEVEGIIHGPDIAILIFVDLGREILVHNGIMEGSTGFAIDILADTRVIRMTGLVRSHAGRVDDILIIGGSKQTVRDCIAEII